MGSVNLWSIDYLHKDSLPIHIRSPNNPFCSQSKIILIFQLNSNQITTLNENGGLYSWNYNISKGKLSPFHVSQLENNTKSNILMLTHATIHRPTKDFDKTDDNSYFSGFASFDGIVAADELGNLIISERMENDSIISVEKYPKVHNGIPLSHLKMNSNGKLVLTCADDNWLKVWKMEKKNGKFNLILYHKYHFNENISILQVKWLVDEAEQFIILDSLGKVYHGTCNQLGISLNCILNCSDSHLGKYRDVEFCDNGVLLGRDQEVNVF